jgi:hypothetical protein
MSLAQSHGDFKGKGKEGWELATSKKSSKQLRRLCQPSSYREDVDTTSIHLNGNTKPQEPAFLRRRPSGIKDPPRMAANIHAKPWSCSTAPGKKENPHHSNPYHRVWLQDAGLLGMPFDDESPEMSMPRRWNRQRKKEYYDKYLECLNSRKCHNEMFGVKANHMYWTHLVNGGTHPGGQEKLDPVPDKKSGSYSYGHLYAGKFSNIQHQQLICKHVPKGAKKDASAWAIDTRPKFDNRLKDDMVRFNDERDRLLAQMNYDIYRPVNTRSCPQMGAEYMHR